jgi:hypothetical protein
MDGASDKAQVPADRRPQLSDFAALPENEIATEDPKAAKAEAQPEATVEKVDQETGEVTEVGVPEAMDMGRQRRRDNLPRRPVDGLTEAEASAFLQGWDEVDDELQQAAKK